MNTRLLLPTLLLLGTGSACASDVPKGREIFRRLDTNGDRTIQLSEIAAARAASFDQLDTNRNGFLDAEEVRAPAQRANASQNVAAISAGDMATLAARMDVNGDRRVSREEFTRFIPDRVRRVDANGDGDLSLRELRAVAPAIESIKP